MGQVYRIKKLRYRHQGILNTMLANPHLTTKEIAHRLGYTPVWVAAISNSDLFKAELAQRARELGIVLGNSLREKKDGLLALTIEEATERIVSGKASEKFVGDTMKTLIQNSEYAAKPPETNINFNFISGDAITAAREKASALARGATTVKAVETGTSKDEKVLELASTP